MGRGRVVDPGLLGTRLKVLTTTTFIWELRVVAIVISECAMNWHRTWWKRLTSTLMRMRWKRTSTLMWWCGVPIITGWSPAPGDWCSEVDSENPAQPIEERPDAPANVCFAIEGVSIRVVWEVAEGADSYNVYYDGRLLTTAVVGTDFVHTEPDYGDYEYWVTACNRGGCSDVDFENPAKPFEDRPSVPANARTVVEGSSIRVSWDPVEGAGYYKIYHDDARADSPQGCHLSFAGAVFRLR